MISAAHGQITDAIGTASLTGLKVFGLAVGELSPETQKDGLKEEQIRSVVNLRLHAAGIGIIPDAGWVDSAASAEIYLEVDALKYGGSQYAYSLRLSVNQKVSLPLKGGGESLAATWSTSELGIVGAAKMPEKIGEEAGALVGRFIEAYRSANPGTVK
jgi:hypothetical protein